MPVTVSQLFTGLDVTPAREFVASLIDPDTHRRIVLPCVGRWATATAIVAKHGHPDRIEASDLCLFSSVVGYLADPRRDLDELGVRLPGHLSRFTAGAADAVEHGAGLLLAVKYLSTPPTTVHANEVRSELWAAAAALRGALAGGLRDQVELLAGCRYEIADVRHVLTDLAEEADEGAGGDVFVYVHAPAGRGGYTRMYGPAERAMWTCLGRLTGAAAFAAAYVHRLAAEEFDPDEAADWHDGDAQMPPGWVKLAAFAAAPQRVAYLIANRDTGDRPVASRAAAAAVRRWPVYADEEITPDSVIEFAEVDRATCLHYRDLFVHRLGHTKAERYCLMLIDGRVTTAFGLHLFDVRRGTKQHVWESFGITITSARYARLGKLFMLALTSGDFRRWLLARFPRLQQADIVGIQTASPTQRHEGKTDRGVLKLVRRVPLPGGGFQLLYQGTFRHDTWPEVMAGWHAQHAWNARPSWDGPRLPPPGDAGGQRKKKGRGAASRDRQRT
jgi:hypothetical protein